MTNDNRRDLQSSSEHLHAEIARLRERVRSLEDFFAPHHSANRPMLSINERLGFQKQPAWISYVKKIRQETDTENR